MKVNAIKKYKLQKSMSCTGLEVMLEPEIQHLHNKENIKLVVPLIHDWEKSFAASDDSYQPKKRLKQSCKTRITSKKHGQNKCFVKISQMVLYHQTWFATCMGRLKISLFSIRNKA